MLKKQKGNKQDGYISTKRIGERIKIKVRKHNKKSKKA